MTCIEFKWRNKVSYKYLLSFLPEKSTAYGVALKHTQPREGEFQKALRTGGILVDFEKDGGLQRCQNYYSCQEKNKDKKDKLLTILYEKLLHYLIIEN